MPDETPPTPPEFANPDAAPRAGGASLSSLPRGASIDAGRNIPVASAPSAGSLAPHAVSEEDAPQRIPEWLQKAERFLRVIVRMYIGLATCWTPWYPPFWDNNPLFLSSPRLMSFITLGAVRGVVSGLGLLNLWIALRDALRKSPGSHPDAE